MIQDESAPSEPSGSVQPERLTLERPATGSVRGRAPRVESRHVENRDQSTHCSAGRGQSAESRRAVRSQPSYDHHRAGRSSTRQRAQISHLRHTSSSEAAPPIASGCRSGTSRCHTIERRKLSYPASTRPRSEVRETELPLSVGRENAGARGPGVAERAPTASKPTPAVITAANRKSGRTLARRSLRGRTKAKTA